MRELTVAFSPLVDGSLDNPAFRLGASGNTPEELHAA
jgi:hypothetical protein